MAPLQRAGDAHDRSAGVTDDDPIEAYLDRLLPALSGTPREIRRTLSEAEAHLHDSAAALQAGGLDAEHARAEAVRRMGPVEAAAPPTLRLTRALRRRLALSALQIGGIAGLAIGIAGLLGRAAEALWGARAIATPFPPGSYSAADCHRWQDGYPAAHDCIAAMTADHADDFLRSAAGAALLGVLALILHARLRRRWGGPQVAAALPAGADLLAGAGLAALVAAGLLVNGLDAVLTTRAQGAGQSFSLAAAALLAAAYFGVRARRRGWTAALR
jgi:hypothetical protein